MAFIDVSHLSLAVQTSWSNMPAALTELRNATETRKQIDMSGFTQARLIVNIGSNPGSTNAEFRVQYSGNGGSSWNYLDASAGPSVNISATGIRVGSWVNLDSGAQADVLVRVVGINGDGVADPSFTQISLQLQ